MLCASLHGLDELQRAGFAKAAVGLWIGLRLGLIGYMLSTYTQLQPVLQYFGFVGPQSAALVGFSIEYSQGIVGIIQQFIMNYSDLEMQLISIERLREYADGKGEFGVGQVLTQQRFEHSGSPAIPPGADLRLEAVQVKYRSGVAPALSDVSL